ncbi:hypothetical protein KIN20_018295 [Parelaphostrongylus tenuis]|uniref:Uncharacterized protein n=1 Tax=Parelaphostrongylus tenuis TaxID=148309 RepID=A0AAD5MJ46_PARTN|nr:hypothetical protein KIN20_018295 [Parelaphostrongylus tenuis]
MEKDYWFTTDIPTVDSFGAISVALSNSFSCGYGRKSMEKLSFRAVVSMCTGCTNER